MTPRTTDPDQYFEELPHGPRTITPVATSTTAFVGAAPSGPVNDPVLIESFAEFERIFGGLSRSSPMSYTVQQFYLNGGIDALIVRVQASGASVTDADIVGVRSARTGIYALEKADIFNLLCIPPLDFATDPDAATTRRAALKYCRERRAMLIVDPPQTWITTDDVKDNIDSFLPRDRNAAIYFPRLRAPDPLQGNQPEDFVPSGAVCGVMARTDAAHGVWKSPAGLRASVAGVTKLSYELSDSDLIELSSLAVNCLRTVPVAGAVIWGTRTLEGTGGLASQWKYVPVRRLALFIEESIGRGIEWAAYEPNAESLWLQLRSSIDAFMQSLYRQGAFQGPGSDDAFFVRCDDTTTTQSDIDSGFVNILVGFAPLRPGEFVILRFRQGTVAG